MSPVQPQTFKSRFVLFASLRKLLLLTANIFLASHNTEPSRCILSAPADLLLTISTLLHDPEADLEGLLVFWGLTSGTLSRIVELRKRGSGVNGFHKVNPKLLLPGSSSLRSSVPWFLVVFSSLPSGLRVTTYSLANIL